MEAPKRSNTKQKFECSESCFKKIARFAVSSIVFGRIGHSKLPDLSLFSRERSQFFKGSETLFIEVSLLFVDVLKTFDYLLPYIIV